MALGHDCGRALLRLLSRGHAVVAELQRCAESLPAGLRERGLGAGEVVGFWGLGVSQN